MISTETILDFARKSSYNASKWYYRHAYTFEIENYESDVDPTRRVLISPSNVNKFTGRIGRDGIGQVKGDIGSVLSGSWDQQSGRNIAPHLPNELTDFLFAEHIEDTGFYQSLYQRFKSGDKWENTEYYQTFNSIIDAGYEWHGCETETELKRRFEQLDKIYESISRSGYKNQYKLNKYFNIMDELAREVVVDCGRKGDSLLVCGRHRLCISKLLGLNEIPVTVCVYHKRWALDANSSA